MFEDAGIENLEETQGADVEEWEDEETPAYPVAAPLPKPTPAPAPAPVASVQAPPVTQAQSPANAEAPPRARTAEDETLAKIIESLGGRDQALKLTLSVKRRRGEPWKQLRPIHIEDWMAQEGLTAAEVIGDQFGNGTYKWELRNQGRYSRSGSCDLEGFDDVPDTKVLSDGEVIEPAEPQTIPVGELVQGAVAAAMQPMAELVGSLRSDLTAILSAKLQTPAAPPAPHAPQQPDPALQTLIGILAQQNTALFELVGRSLTERASPSRVATIPTMKEDHFKSSLRNLKELVGIANELRSVGLPVPEMPVGFPGDIGDDEEADDLGDVLEFPAPAVEESGDNGTLFNRAGTRVGESLERILTNFLRYGEEKLQSEVLGAAGVSPGPEQATQTLSGAAPAAPGLTAETVRDLEHLFKLVDDCVRSGITVEEFKEHVLTKVPEQFLGLVKTGKLSADDLAELSKFLGKPEMTKRLKCRIASRIARNDRSITTDGTVGKGADRSLPLQNYQLACHSSRIKRSPTPSVRT